MTIMLQLLLRFCITSVGFLCACFVTAITYSFLEGLIRISDFYRYDEAELAVSIIIGTVGIAMQIAQIAFLPVMAVICVFEIKSVRSWLAYVAAVAAVAIFIFFMITPNQSEVDFSRLANQIVSAMIGASFYWFMIGQRAGVWLKRI